MRRLFIYAPLLVLPVLIYNIIAFSTGGPASGELPQRILAKLGAPMFTLPMMSGGKWGFSLGDFLLLLALLMLFVEILKSTSTRSPALINHGFSMVLMLICLLEFLMLDNFATSAFFLITVMALLDVLAGFMVSVVSARRDFGVGDGIVS